MQDTNTELGKWGGVLQLLGIPEGYTGHQSFRNPFEANLVQGLKLKWGFPKFGVPVGGPYHKDYSILGPGLY